MDQFSQVLPRHGLRNGIRGARLHIIRCSWPGLLLIFLVACRVSLWMPTPTPTPTPTVPPEEVDWTTLKDLRRLPLDTPIVVGFYELRLTEVRVGADAVEARLYLRRLSQEEAERQKFFNPLFLSAGEEYGFVLRLVTLAAGQRRFLIPHLEGVWCGASGEEAPGWEGSLSCRFPVPEGQQPVYLLLQGLRRGAVLWLPVPFTSEAPLALFPLGVALAGMEGLLPETAFPPGTTAHLPEGMEVTVLDARWLPSVELAYGGERAPGEGWAFLAVRLQLNCPPTGCRVGVFSYASEMGQTSCTYLGPPLTEIVGGPKGRRPSGLGRQRWNWCLKGQRRFSFRVYWSIRRQTVSSATSPFRLRQIRKGRFSTLRVCGFAWSTAVGRGGGASFPFLTPFGTFQGNPGRGDAWAFVPVPALLIPKLLEEVYG